jgi:hypothetical protein
MENVNTGICKPGQLFFYFRGRIRQLIVVVAILLLRYSYNDHEVLTNLSSHFPDHFCGKTGAPAHFSIIVSICSFVVYRQKIGRLGNRRRHVIPGNQTLIF